MIYSSDHIHIPTSANRQSSTLDLFLTNVPEIITPACVINDLSSDHLLVDIKVTPNFTRADTFKYDFSKANWSSYLNYMNRNINLPILDNITTVEQIDDMRRTFINLIKEAMRRNIPRKSSYSSRATFPNYLRDIIQLKNRIHRNWQCHRDVIFIVSND